MDSHPKLNFPRINLRATHSNGQIMVYDEVRSVYVVLTPEEWVRRHLVAFLINQCGAMLRSIIEEYPVKLNTMAQRADVVVMNSFAQPILLAECKSPDVNLSNAKILRDVFAQATRYNAVIKARYIIITNGINHFCYEYSGDSYKPLAAFPKLG